MYARLLARCLTALAVAGMALIGYLAFPHSGASASLGAVRSAQSFTAQAAPALVATPHDVNLAALPAAAPSQISPRANVPYRTPWGSTRYAQLKAAARTAPVAVSGPKMPPPSPAPSMIAPSLESPSASRNFIGLTQASQGAVSGAGSIAPSDGGIACSTSYCVEGINSAIAVYNSSGTLQSGYPKSLAAFDGATCAGGTAIPFDTDAWYDGSHFGVISETSNGVDGCSEVSGFYYAISTTNNPLTATWHVYHFDLSQGSTVFCDFPKAGFNAAAVYFSCNNYANQGSGSFTNALVRGCNKAAMVAGNAVTCSGFFVNQFAVQPAKTLDNANALVANTELFVSSNNGGPSGLNVSTFRNATSGTPQFDTISLPTNNYGIPPSADDNQNNGGCAACLETGDNRIGSSVYERYGHLYLAFNSVGFSQTKNVPASYWADIELQLDDTGLIKNTTSVYQQGTWVYSSDAGAYYPVILPDAAGNVMLAFDYSGATLGPESVVAGRRATYTLGSFHDGGIVYQGGATAPSGRWGDYNTASFDGANLWFELEVSSSTTGWSTNLVRLNYTPSKP